MLAYNSLYPNLIPEGCEQKGYAVSSMVYPTLIVIMTPIAAVLYKRVGVAVILIFQGVMSLLAAAMESGIRVEEARRAVDASGMREQARQWLRDVKEALRYLKEEKGVAAVYGYSAVSNGVANGCSPILVAFFSTAPGMTVAMYSLFSVAEFAGRAIGALFHYHREIPRKRRFAFAFTVYQTYSLMDMALLWLPYPLMLANRAVCGFLGVNSATMREAAVQRYIPDALRAKLNALSYAMTILLMLPAAILIGALGEVMDYRLVVTLGGAVCFFVGILTVWKQRARVRRIYNREDEAAPEA